MRAVLVVVGQNATDPTKRAVAEKPAAAVGGKGPGGGVTALALITAVLAAFCGGFGISAFVRKRPPPAEPTPARQAPPPVDDSSRETLGPS